MAFGYRRVDRDQPFLMPPDVRDWLPSSHLVWVLLDTVAALDLSALHARRRLGGVGRQGYDPAMLLGLLLYGYCTGVRSSRQIERLCEVDVAYRVLCAQDVPDHSTIARFRSDNDEQISGLFGQVLAVCARAGLGRVGVVALDGTKIAANASTGANRDAQWLQAEVDKMLAEARSVDAAEDVLFGAARGDELPDGMGDAKTRRGRIRRALEDLNAEYPAPDGGSGTVRPDDAAPAAERTADHDAPPGRTNADDAPPSNGGDAEVTDAADAATSDDPHDAATSDDPHDVDEADDELSDKADGADGEVPGDADQADDEVNGDADGGDAERLPVRVRQAQAALARAQASHAAVLAKVRAGQQRMRERRQAAHDRGEHHSAPKMKPPHRYAQVKKAAARVARARRRLARELDRAARQAAQRAAKAAARAAQERAAARRNITDPDSRLMPARNGGWVQGYNAQIVVTEDGLIVAADVVNSSADTPQLVHMMDVLAAGVRCLDAGRDRTQPVGTLLADAGYFSHDNLAAPGPDRLIADTTRQRLNAAPPPQTTPGPDATLAQLNAHRLRTDEGKALYKRRGATVEPVFGTEKETRGVRRFSRRGLPPVRHEWTLISIAHNLCKLHTLTAARAAQGA